MKELVLCLDAQWCLTLCDSMDCSAPGSSSRQKYWGGLPCLPPGDLPNPGIKPRSPTLQSDSFYHLSHQGSPWKVHTCIFFIHPAVYIFWLVHLIHLPVIIDLLLLFTQSCSTLCDAMDCSAPTFPVLYYLPELGKTHVHWVGDAIQPSRPLSSPSPPTFTLSWHQGLFQWIGS